MAQSSRIYPTIAAAILVAIIYNGIFASAPLLPVQPGDTVLVTGSSTGIGKHAALSLVKEGFTVFACVRKENDGQALIQSAEKFNLDTSLLKPIILDVTNSEHIQQAVETVSSFVGDRGLKGLFNNAGVQLELSKSKSIDSTSVEFLDLSIYRQTFDVNFFGLVQVTQAFLPLLRKGKGRIIMNASASGYIGFPFLSAYSSSKHAVEGFSDSLRRELLPLGVKVSIIEPGFVMTPILALTIPEGMEPYREEERAMYTSAWKDAINAASPKVTSEAVIDAMRSKKPQTRYSVGGNSALTKFLSYLPASWLDNLLLHAPKQTVTEEYLVALLKTKNTEFEL